MAFEYAMSTHDERSNPVTVRLSDMLRYAEAIDRQDVAAALRALSDHGCQYTGQHSAVLAGAWRDLGWPKLWKDGAVPPLGRGNSWEDTRARCS